MVNYRRHLVPGGSYFFTLTLSDRSSSILTTQAEILRSAFRNTMKRHPFTIDAIVILPDHIHMIWTLPNGDSDYSNRIRLIKGGFTRQLLAQGMKIHRKNGNDCRLWQTRFWEHTIRDNEDMTNHINYIHYNPVKHGHTKSVKEWPWSSFHKYVASGAYPPDWGHAYKEIDGTGHE